MRTQINVCLVLIIGFLSNYSINAQGALCSDIEPFCAGDQRLTFPNSNFTNSNQITGEAGPDYGCLDEQPYPAWFFLQIEEPGNLTFKISQYENPNATGAPLDVDFVVWGPFERGEEYCSASSLSSGQIIDCSYLPDAVEQMSIPGAQANEIYVVVITNFEQVPGFISLEQINTGQGSTDCSILELDLGDNIAVCGEAQYILDGTSDEAVKYEWFVFNEASSQYEVIPNEDGPTLTVTTSGNYKLIITDELEGKTEEDDVNVTFYQKPQIGEVSILSVCEENTEMVDLTEISGPLIAPNSGNESKYEVRYYASLEDIENGNRVLQPQTFTFEENKTIYAIVIDRQSGCKSLSENFQLKTFDFPEFNLAETTIFCVDQNLDLLNSVKLGQDLGEGFNYEWRVDDVLMSTNAVVQFDDFPVASEISVIIDHPVSGCKLVYFTVPAAVSKPVLVEVEVSGSDFGDGYTVAARPENFEGGEFASFLYRLDNGAWQEANVFTDVPPGSHTVSVRELNGCGSTTSESFFLVGYPRFFTPNSDGYNDNWNLITDNNISIKQLFVFDRYGKLIARVDPTSKGWDGTYNGNDLPADDYWFRVEFIDEKTGRHQEYMSNFSLMR